MPRVPRFIARDLIQYAKSLQVTASSFDPQARSAFEFARQMSSPKLKKINPQFECVLEAAETASLDAPPPPSIKAEFLDGNKWVLDTTGISAEHLRSEFYRRAGDAEDNMDGSPAESAAAAAAKGKGGDKGAGKGKK